MDNTAWSTWPTDRQLDRLQWTTILYRGREAGGDDNALNASRRLPHGTRVTALPPFDTPLNPWAFTA